MKYLTGAALVILTAAIFLTSCSQGISPIEPLVTEPSHQLSNVSNSHSLWGMYTFTCDPGRGTVEVIPLREADMHLNALKFLEPPPLSFLTIEGVPQFSGNIIDIDIGLRNPYLGLVQYSAFDVCGIVFTHGSFTGFSDPGLFMAGEEDTHLLNPDGFTRWWNPLEFPHDGTVFHYNDGLIGTPAEDADYNCKLNGYKYFADGLGKYTPLTELDSLKRGLFTAGQQNIRHYRIDLSGGWEFNYAVDACWKKPEGGSPYEAPDDFPPGANRQEAYNIEVKILENTLFFDYITLQGGGELELRITVRDHFNPELNQVYGESLAGLTLTCAPDPVETGDSYAIFEISFNGDSLLGADKAQLLITIESEAEGYGGALPGEPVCAYFIYQFVVLEHIPEGWARSWGGGGNDMVSSLYQEWGGVAPSSDGNIFIAGIFADTVDFDPGPGVDIHTSNGQKVGGIFLSKFDQKGVLQWCKTWSHKEDIDSSYIASDGFGNAYVLASSPGLMDLDPGPGEDLKGGEFRNTFLSKFSADGDYVWGRCWEATLEDNELLGSLISTDGDGNIFVSGNIWNTVDLNPGPGVDEYSGVGEQDCFLIKLDANGNYLWGKCWGGEGRDIPVGITARNSDALYITGRFEPPVDFDPGPGIEEITYEEYADDNRDIFLSKFDLDGNFQWVRAWGGWKPRVAADDAGNVYVAGYFNIGLDFDPGPDIWVLDAIGHKDMFISKFDQHGDFHWAHRLGGWGFDESSDIAVDNDGNVLFAGYFSGNVDFDMGPGTAIRGSGDNSKTDSFLVKHSPDAIFQWVHTWHACGHYITTGVGGNVYVGGYIIDPVSFAPEPHVDYHTSNGVEDVYLLKLSPDGTW